MLSSVINIQCKISLEKIITGFFAEGVNYRGFLYWEDFCTRRFFAWGINVHLCQGGIFPGSFCLRIRKLKSFLIICYNCINILHVSEIKSIWIIDSCDSWRLIYLYKSRIFRICHYSFFSTLFKNSFIFRES